MGEMSIVNKVLVCCCCTQAACFAGSVYDSWGGCQANLQCALHCCGGCWTVCYPICASLSLGDTAKGTDQCVLGVKYCLLSCGLCIAGMVDSFINCFCYTRKIFTEGVTGWKDVTENAQYLGAKVRSALEVEAKSE